MANWAIPLDIAQVMKRVKRYVDSESGTFSQVSMSNTNLYHGQTPARFRPVPSDIWYWCFDRETGREKPSVTISYSFTHVYKNTDLQNFPIELYSEIARHLLPIDLLNLARTSKVLRAILLYKGNRHIWRTSLLAVPLLPPCPKDMSEPLYTALLFDKWCWACGSRDGDSVDYFLRLRLCRLCFYENVVSGVEFDLLQDLSEAVRDVVTMSLPCQMRRETCYINDNTDVSPLSHIREDRYFKPELHAMIEKLSSPTVIQDCMEEYLLERAEYIRQRHMGAVELYKWEDKIIKFSKYDGLRLARGFIWSQAPDGSDFCQSLKPCSPPVSEELTQLWLIPLLNAKEKHQIEREHDFLNSRVWCAHKVRLERRKALLSEWALRMLAQKYDLNMMPTKAHIGEMLEHYADKDDARCSLDAILWSTLDDPVKSEEASRIQDSLIRSVTDYYYRSRATAALQVHRRIGEKKPDEFILGRGEVNNVMCLKVEAYFPILHRPDALFECQECSLPPRPWKEVHAHFREAHHGLCGLNEEEYGLIKTPIPQWSGSGLAREIVAEAGFGKDASIYSLSQLIASGQLTCTCGEFRPSSDVPFDWPTFVHHIHEHIEEARTAEREQAYHTQRNYWEASAPQADVDEGWRVLVKMLPEAPAVAPSLNQRRVTRPRRCKNK